jgi:hypothetical protein
MVVNLSFFLMSRRLFCGRDANEREKIRSDLKNSNASWSLYHGCLARETLANKWRGL